MRYTTTDNVVIVTTTSVDAAPTKVWASPNFGRAGVRGTNTDGVDNLLVVLVKSGGTGPTTANMQSGGWVTYNLAPGETFDDTNNGMDVYTVAASGTVIGRFEEVFA